MKPSGANPRQETSRGGVRAFVVAILALATAPMWAGQPPTGLVITGPPGSGAGAVPMTLSENPALLATARGEGHTVPGVLEYVPSAALWSDNTAKSRYMALPEGGRIAVGPQGAWSFPERTVLVKNFVMPMDERPGGEGALRRLESRVLFRWQGAWLAYTYQWNAEQTDATMVSGAGGELPLQITRADGSTLDYVWRFPARNECFRCHTAPAGVVLGVKAAYLNHAVALAGGGPEPVNQLDAWDSLSVFDPALPPAAERPAIPDYRDTTVSVGDRAKAYLASNCAMCHQPGGGTPTAMDVRWEVPAQEMGVVDVYPSRFDFEITDPLLIAPGDADRSVLLRRMEVLDPYLRMPVIGSSRVDPHGVALMREWITKLGEPVATGDAWQMH